ncbi:hypothetical protein BDQ12DRAFT_244241 [Crucibulum laeve]|uniref:Uncharacterized protein n=1 Tax=Crucibulum laeve TaxID=68775 RepID=A0A5C3LWS3_9AGAR|nr:hypothetical protein BDQ12DRAFT_244241 [Crucibulum laeve]
MHTGSTNNERTDNTISRVAVSAVAPGPPSQTRTPSKEKLITYTQPPDQLPYQSTARRPDLSKIS